MKAGLFILIIAVITGLIIKTDIIQWVATAKSVLDPTLLQTKLLFMGLTLAIALTILPVSGIIIPMGYMFGLVLGTILSLISLTVGATIVFFVPRYSLYDWITRTVIPKFPSFDRLNTKIGSAGLTVSTGIRLVPIPFWMINTALAVTSVSAREYILGTCIGLIPSVALLNFIGSTLDAPGNNLIIAVSLYAIFLIIVRVLYRFQR